MPSKTGKPVSTVYKNDLTIDQTTNIGIDTTARRIQDGDGNNSSAFISDDVFHVYPNNDNSTQTLTLFDNAGNLVLSGDTTNKLVKVNESQVAATTMFKEMGLYDFSPTAGYHYPLIANTMFVPTGATAFAGDNDWGNGTDPAATLDVSGLTAQENAIAVYWYLENNITLDSVRYMATADSSDSLNFHLVAYTLDVSSNHGDLSGGTIHASVSGVSATSTTVKTGTFTLDSADIDASKVVIGFVESDSTTDVSVSFNIRYHIR